MTQSDMDCVRVGLFRGGKSGCDGLTTGGGVSDGFKAAAREWNMGIRVSALAVIVNLVVA